MIKRVVIGTTKSYDKKEATVSSHVKPWDLVLEGALSLSSLKKGLTNMSSSKNFSFSLPIILSSSRGNIS